MFNLGKIIYQSPREKQADIWYEKNGDLTYRLDYNLSERSVVIDLGGFEGNWASDIFAKFCCKIFVFEAVPQYASNIKKRFSNNKNIRVFEYGLSDKNSSEKMMISDEGSSVFKSYNIGSNAEEVDVKFVDVVDFFNNEKLEMIDLIKINIEGAEYDLLDSMIANGLIEKFRSIQVQFHDFVPNAEARMRKIQQELEKTHELTYQFPFVWENWCLK